MRPHHPRGGSITPWLVFALFAGACLFLLGGSAPMPGLTLDPAGSDPGLAGTFLLQAAACLGTGFLFQDPQV